MKKPISKWTIAFLLIGLAACKPKKAIQLRAAIDQKERTASNYYRQPTLNRVSR